MMTRLNTVCDTGSSWRDLAFSHEAIKSGVVSAASSYSTASTLLLLLLWGLGQSD